MGDHRAAIINGAKSVLRTGTVFDLSPESVAFAAGIDIERVYAECPASNENGHILSLIHI